MSKAAVFFVENFEEIEAIAPVDILRRGGAEVDLISLTGSIEVKGSHGITARMDKLYAEVNRFDYDLYILPGGPGTESYLDHEAFTEMLKSRGAAKIGAICAAPSVLGRLGLLRGKKAICYPGYEKYLEGAQLSPDSVVTDGNITTARGAGAALPFGFRLLAELEGEEKAAEIRKSMAE
ncbi:MAG: DJ-1/PfpI family protein [Clostridiales bacterium]|jgi:4-methyl-5(b-hydroxyethyl)-thiazole monophosphate biosynthesis|nr:DJ-1/PfpI family protein [Clostridiales bacterium]